MKRIFILAFLACLFAAGSCSAANLSETWKKLLNDRSSTIIVEGMDIGGLIVGGRGKISFTWLDKKLSNTLKSNRDLPESVSNGLVFYMSNKPSVMELMKGRDVFLLTYRPIKNWNFKVEEIVINGYRLTENDILNEPFYRVLGDLPSMKARERLAEEDEDMEDFVLHVAVPSMPKSGKIKISYGADEVEWQIPKK